MPGKAITGGRVLILAIDTSERTGSIALLDNGHLVSEAVADDHAVHSVWLMPALDGFLKETGVCLASIDLFAVTAGPGSFTGVRVGISTIKGLAWTLKKDTVAVSALAALSLNASATGLSGNVVCPLLDARKGEVYSALYWLTPAGTEALTREGVVSVDGLFKGIDDLGLDRSTVVFIGSGLTAYADAVRRNVKEAKFAPIDAWRIRASAVGRLAYEGILSFDAARPALNLAPVYLRRPETEFKQDARVATPKVT